MGKARLETDYLIAFRPEPDRPGGPTVAQRIRQLLKIAGRSLGLRCVTVAPALPADVATDVRTTGRQENRADRPARSNDAAQSDPGRLLDSDTPP